MSGSCPGPRRLERSRSYACPSAAAMVSKVRLCRGRGSQRRTRWRPFFANPRGHPRRLATTGTARCAERNALSCSEYLTSEVTALPSTARASAWVLHAATGEGGQPITERVLTATSQQRSGARPDPWCESGHESCVARVRPVATKAPRRRAGAANPPHWHCSSRAESGDLSRPRPRRRARRTLARRSRLVFRPAPPRCPGRPGSLPCPPMTASPACRRAGRGRRR